MDIPRALQSMLTGEQGPTRQKAARLVIDLSSVAGADSFVECDHAHVSGVSVLTGGAGLRRFLADLTGDPEGKVAIPTTLNSAGCDRRKMEEMEIAHPDFLERQFEIIQAYDALGIEATLSCTPYDRGIETRDGIGSWSESNAVCFSNSYTSLITNRESGLSALATALTGWAPRWGLHLPENRAPNLLIEVEADMDDATDWSILGDWIGMHLSPEWEMPWGVMPRFVGLPSDATFEMRKALTAAAANHGCAMLWADGLTDDPPPYESVGTIRFTEADLRSRYADLAPTGTVDLVVIGCPQASVGEVRATAAAVRTRMELGQTIPDQRLWVFTSGHNHAILEADGSVDLLEQAGAVVLQDTCPEVTPYNPSRYGHLLTNSMKAEHYLTSGLNRMPTSVARIEGCVAHSFDPNLADGPRPLLTVRAHSAQNTSKSHREGECDLLGQGLLSQQDWKVHGRALVTDVPITYLGFVNRETGVIEESGHPLDGTSISDTVLIYPKGSGSTVAPYVLMGLIYEGRGPRAIVTRDICPLTIPAASLLGIPYASGFDADPCMEINSGDEVEMKTEDGAVVLTVIRRSEPPSDS